MNAITRGVRNAFRNSVRTFAIAAILGLSIGLALAMLVARASVQEKIESVKQSIGNTVTVTPAGVQGFQGGGEPLTDAQLDEVGDLSHVTKVVRTLSDRLTSDNTDLESAVEAGSLGERGAGNAGITFMAPPQGFSGSIEGGEDGSGEITRVFTPPVVVTGTTDATNSSAFSGSVPSYTSGDAFDASKDEDVAVVGKAIAEKNNLSVGSTFTAYGKTITVVGIFDTGNTFANNGVVMQIAALQRLSEQTDSVTSATVTVDSIDNIDGAVTAIKAALGDTADVVSSQESADQAIEPLQSVVAIATFSLVGAVIAGAVIILMAMVMVVRERRREIGVFKAIGASNAKVVFQFMSEAVTLTMLGMIAGVIIGAAVASPVTSMLVSNSANDTTSTETQVEGGPRFGGMRIGNLRTIGNDTLESARTVQASVGTEIIAYGFVMAFVIAIVGSALPAFAIAKIRPAEVMRAE